MKSVKFILAVAAIFVGFSASAQDWSDDKLFGKWGATAEEREANYKTYSFFKEDLNNKNYASATEQFQFLLANCPKADVNIYKYGSTLYKNRINRAKSVAEKRGMLDSLMIIYDLRIEYFGDQEDLSSVYDVKARDVLKYGQSNRALLRSSLKDAVDYAVKSNSVKIDIAAMYYKTLCEDYISDDSLTPDMILDEYERLAPYFEGVEDEKGLANKKIFEDSFANSGAANCDNLEELFKEKIAANPDDAELVKKAVSLMSRQGCTSDFYFEITEKHYAAEPSSEMALFLAKGFQDRKEFSKALKYLREALAVETDPAKKEPLYAQIAIIELSAGNLRAAADAARSLKSLNPSNGYSYFVLGQCYASSVCEDGLGGGSIYWAAYDEMSQAIDRLGSEPSIQAVARKLAGSYRAGFPSQETCFFKELQAGQGFTVPCGMASGKKTTVRYR